MCFEEKCFEKKRRENKKRELCCAHSFVDADLAIDKSYVVSTFVPLIQIFTVLESLEFESFPITNPHKISSAFSSVNWNIDRL